MNTEDYIVLTMPGCFLVEYKYTLCGNKVSRKQAMLYSLESLHNTCMTFSVYLRFATQFTNISTRLTATRK